MVCAIVSLNMKSNVKQLGGVFYNPGVHKRGEVRRCESRPLGRPVK